jgi:hypothetical protein
MTEKGDRPIPVRELLAGGRKPVREGTEGPDQGDEDVVLTPDPGLEPRVVELGGVPWTVEALGRTRSGHVADTGALLLTVGFTPAGDPGSAGSAERAAGRREALAVARTLDDLSLADLEDLLQKSRVKDPGDGVSN